MRRAISLLLVVCMSGCATLQPVPLTVPEEKWVENNALPEDPKEAKVAAPDGEWAAPENEGDCTDKNGKPVSDAPKPCPAKGGVLISEGLAARFKLYQQDSKALRALYLADKLVWMAQRQLYETKLRMAGEAAQQNRPNWFQQHAAELGILFGLIIGAGAAVGIVYGVAPAFKQQP